MKLLFITQKIDKDDDILGVYHRWIEELSKKVEKINVICLYRGKVELPDNVRVFSLGKENGQSRIKYLFRFYKYIWKLRNDYDKVFVHMNPEYIILAGWLWKLLDKKIFFWYNHPLGNLRTRLAIWFANIVLHTSPFAFSARYKKSKIMPVGVDTNSFRNLEIKKLKNSILYLGRISPIKKLELLLKAVSTLRTSDVFKIKLTIVGASTSDKPVELRYYERIKTMTEELDLAGIVELKAPISNYETPKIYNEHDIFVNLTPTGSFDKTIIEAMACETLTLVSNESLKRTLPPQFLFQQDDAQDLANKIKAVLSLGERDKKNYAQKMRAYAVNNHSLEKLISALYSQLTTHNS